MCSTSGPGWWWAWHFPAHVPRLEPLPAVFAPPPPRYAGAREHPIPSFHGGALPYWIVLVSRTQMVLEVIGHFDGGDDKKFSRAMVSEKDWGDPRAGLNHVPNDPNDSSDL